LGHVDLTPSGAAVTQTGLAFLDAVGVHFNGVLPEYRARARLFCRPCMDWSERRPHLAGLVGRSRYHAFLDQKWLRPAPVGRAVTITPTGVAALEQFFGMRSFGTHRPP
jgi:hypothetical protein